MIRFTTLQLVQMARRAFEKGKFTDCLSLLGQLPPSERPQEIETKALYRAGKLKVATGHYNAAKDLFAEAMTRAPEPSTKALLQERNQLLNRILTRKQVAVTGLDQVFRCAHVKGPKRLPNDAFVPLIWFVGCPASYRSRRDMERNDPLSALIRMMKSGVERTTIEHLGRFLAAFINDRSPVLSRADLVIPVPSDPGRATDRGYSIPRILAEQISALCAVPLHDELIVVSGEAPELRNIPSWMRSTAIEGVFDVQGKAHWLESRSVLVVDDVITSGSTVCEVAKVLKGHGAGEVAAVALAHTERSVF